MTEAPQVFVQPGEIHWSVEPRLFKTVLGSCIAVCLWDEVMRVGGINHFILPRATDGPPSARFGDVAVSRLLEALRGLGCQALVAKVFGGAAVLPAARRPTVGEANVAIALAMLQAARIPIVAQRTGGIAGVVIQFHSFTGDVNLREIQGAK